MMRGAFIIGAIGAVGALGVISACTLFVDTGDLSNSSRAESGDADPSKGNPSLVGDGSSGSSGSSSSGGADGEAPDGQSPGSYADMVRVTPGLIAYWRFGDAVGSTTATSALAGVTDGKISQGITLGTPGVINNDPSQNTSFEFKDDTESKVVDFGTDGFAFEDKTPFSIELWHSPTSLNSFQALIARHNLLNPGGAGWAMSVENPYGYAIYREDGDDGDAIETRFVPNVGDNHHLVATFDGTLLHLYVDAKEPKPALNCKRAIPVIPNLSLRVGVSTFGRIDEVALYNRALTAEEVSAHYTKGK